MKRPFTGARTAALVTALALALTACGGGSGSSNESGEPQHGGTLNYVVFSEVASLDPAKIQPSSGAGAPPGLAIFDALMVIDAETGEVEPKLAESLTPDETAQVWTLTLREGVEFSDGTPYDAKAVKFNWERMADPKVASVAADDAAKIKAMTVKSPTELQITLAKPDSAFDRGVAQRMFMIGSPTGLQDGDPDTQPVGAGPFVLEDWVRDSSKTLTRNENYYDAPRPYLDELVFQVVTDTTQSATMLKSGQGDMALYWDAKVAGELTAGGLSSATVLSPGSPSLALNNGQAPFDDPDVRRAMALAIDTNQAAKVLQRFTPAPAPFAEDVEHNFDLGWPEPDADEAQRLFNEYAARTGGPLRFTIGVFQETGAQADARYLQSVLNQFDNVQVELKVQAAAAAIGDVLSQSYQAHGWGSPWWNAADLDKYLRTGSLFNVFGYSNPDVDAALEAAKTSADPEVRNKAYETVVTRMIEDIPMINYGMREVSNVHTDAVHGVEAHGDGLVYLERVWKS